RLSRCLRQVIRKPPQGGFFMCFLSPYTTAESIVEVDTFAVAGVPSLVRRGGKHLPVPAANLAAAMPGPHPPCGHLPPCDGGRKGSPVPVVRLIPRSPFPCTTLLSGRKTQAFLPPPAGVRGEAPGMAPAFRSEEGARRADGGHHRPISNACRILAST